MPRVQAPLFSPVYQNVDLVSLRDDSAEGYNFILDEKGGVERRGGVRRISSTPGFIRGMYRSFNNLITMVDSSGAVRTLGANRTTFTSPSSGTLSPGASFYSICQDSGTRLYFADGGYISYWEGSSVTPLTRLTVGPSACTHVAYLDFYILGLQANGQTFYFSDVDDGLTWPGTNLERVRGANDWLTALHVYDSKIFLYGIDSLEVWENDGETPFSRVPGGLYLNGGLTTATNVVMTTRGPVWLNTNNRVCMWDGGVQELPGPFESSFTSSSSLSGVASIMYHRGRQMVCFYFASLGRSFVFDVDAQQPIWHEVSFFKDGVASGFPLISCVNGTLKEESICGFGDRAGLYQLDRSYYYDDDATSSNVIRGYRVSGSIDYGTNVRKRSNGMRIRLKRGSDGSATRASGSTEPMIQIRYRDDGGAWSNYYNIGLGFQGETEIVVPIFNRGIFRTRQYELLATDTVPIVYGFAEEDLEVLSS